MEVLSVKLLGYITYQLMAKIEYIALGHGSIVNVFKCRTQRE